MPFSKQITGTKEDQSTGIAANVRRRSSSGDGGFSRQTRRCVPPRAYPRMTYTKAHETHARAAGTRCKELRCRLLSFSLRTYVYARRTAHTATWPKLLYARTHVSPSLRQRAYALGRVSPRRASPRRASPRAANTPLERSCVGGA